MISAYLDTLNDIMDDYSGKSMTLGDIIVLTDVCKGRGLVVELGTFKGHTTMLLSRLANKVESLDIFEDVGLIEDEHQKKHYAELFTVHPHFFDDVRQKLEPFKNVVIHKGVTYQNAPAYLDKSIEVLFVDADHSLEGVAKDFNSFFSKIKVGGFFLFHDSVNIDPAYGVGEFCSTVLDKDTRLKKRGLKPVLDNVELFTSFALYEKIKEC